jgi:hypothetical protein
MTTPKTTITITYRRAGTQPPIFIAGEFSDPPWEPQEMDFTTDEDGGHTFKKDIPAYAGSKVQYKFRVGLGDWWVLNEAAPTAVDSAGILNNVAEVPPSDTGTSTPAIAKTADEVADTAAMLDKDAEPAKDTASNDSSDAHGQDTLKKAAEGLDELQSESKPPVANAAKAVINAPASPPLSGTSATDIANTATEVADTAALLDDDIPAPSSTEPQVANAAKELLSRTEPHSESGASTPSFVRTAAEVADTAALLDKDDELQSDAEPPVANAAKELLNRAELQSRSGASTPSFVKTTVEVADSAALLDKEEPEEEVTDEEAGRIGYRRMSTTPIPDVAVTAAEVADTAQQLDADVSFDHEYCQFLYD